MESPNWNRYAGVAGDTIVMDVHGLDLSQTISSVTAKVWDEAAAPSTATTLTASVINAKRKRVRVELGAWLQGTAVAGTVYRGQLFPVIDGQAIPWPEGDAGQDEPGYFTITVHPKS